MSDIKSSLTGSIAGLAATFLVSSGFTADAQAQQDNKVDTAVEAVSVLYDPSKEVNLSRQEADFLNEQKKRLEQSGASIPQQLQTKLKQSQERQNEATEQMVNAQKQITELFGRGYDANFAYDYQYKAERYTQNQEYSARRINTSIDCDMAFLSVQKYQADADILRDNGKVIKQGKPYLQISMQPTMSMITPFHLALNGANPDPNPQIEKQVEMASRQSFYPIGQPQTKSPATHIFQMKASDFADFDGNERELGSHHKIPYSVAENMLEESCGARLNELNEDLLDRFAKPPSGP